LIARAAEMELEVSTSTDQVSIVAHAVALAISA
jgi:hypothetical protein